MNKSAFITEYIGYNKISILERLHEALETIEELREYLAQSDTLYFKVRIEELQYRIAELEASKTCDGCIHKNRPYGSISIDICAKCTRYIELPDYYEPKEQL